MKTNKLDQFAADTIKAPATVTGGCGGLVTNLLSGLLGGTSVDLGVGVGVGCGIKVGVGANVNLGGGHGGCH